jgi:hypothetical protein
MELKPFPLQYTGGHVALWHSVSTQLSSNLVGKPIESKMGRPFGTLVPAIALGFLNGQVQVCYQLEDPVVPRSRRVPLLFARTGEIIE